MRSFADVVLSNKTQDRYGRAIEHVQNVHRFRLDTLKVLKLPLEFRGHRLRMSDSHRISR